jgi:hypothetical protein
MMNMMSSGIFVHDAYWMYIVLLYYVIYGYVIQVGVLSVRNVH